MIMADDTEQQPIRRPSRREISRRPVVVGLIGLVGAEAVAGGINWKVLSQALHKITLAFAPPVPTPTSLSAGATLYTYEGHSNAVNAVEWSPDSKRIVSGSDDQTAQVWDANNGGNALIYRGQAGEVLTVAWSPDGRHIALGGKAQGPTPTPPTATATSGVTPTPTATSGVTPTDTPTPTAGAGSATALSTTSRVTPTDTP